MIQRADGRVISLARFADILVWSLERTFPNLFLPTLKLKVPDLQWRAEKQILAISGSYLNKLACTITSGLPTIHPEC